MTPDNQSAEVLALHIRIKQLEAALRDLLKASQPQNSMRPGYVYLAEAQENASAALDDRSAP